MAYGRLADGATSSRRSEMKNIAAQLSISIRTATRTSAQVTPFLDFVIGPQIKTMFLALMGAVAFVLLIACSNVANLLLARTGRASRRPRRAQASRWRIVRQLLVEACCSLISGIAGWASDAWGFNGSTASPRTSAGHWMTFDIDARVFGSSRSVCIATVSSSALRPRCTFRRRT